VIKYFTRILNNLHVKYTRFGPSGQPYTCLKHFVIYNEFKYAVGLYVSLTIVDLTGNGPPLDYFEHKLIEVTLPHLTYIIMGVLAAVGLVVAIALFIFNIAFRQNTYVI